MRDGFGKNSKKPVSEANSLEPHTIAFGDIQKGNSKVCPTRLVDDTPAEDDLMAFQGDIGRHKRVAQAIAEIIRTLDEKPPDLEAAVTASLELLHSDHPALGLAKARDPVRF